MEHACHEAFFYIKKIFTSLVSLCYVITPSGDVNLFWVKPIHLTIEFFISNLDAFKLCTCVILI